MCYWIVYPPDSPYSIPDSAPGLSQQSTKIIFTESGDQTEVPESDGEFRERLENEKEELFKNLRIVHVDRYMLAPHMFMAATTGTSLKVKKYPEYVSEEKAEESKKESSKKPILSLWGETPGMGIQKFAVNNWIDDPRPIRIKKTIFLKMPIGLMQMVPEGIHGLQIRTSEYGTEVFILENFRTLIIPNDFLDELDVIGSNSEKIKMGDFVLIEDGSIGISLGQKKDDDSLVIYCPDFDGFIQVDEWKKIEIK